MIYAKISTAILCCKNCCGVKKQQEDSSQGFADCFPRNGTELISRSLLLIYSAGFMKNPEGGNPKKAGRILQTDLANHIKPAH